MGDAGDHQAERGEFLGLDELGLGAFEVVVGFFEFEAGQSFGVGELDEFIRVLFELFVGYG